jgi:Cft2 family RNA processing exonuclease
VIEWSDDLKIRDADLFLDARNPRECSFVSHAHSDHICLHKRSIATRITTELMNHRLEGGCPTDQTFEYDSTYSLDDRTTQLKLLPAGHVLGSAMVHVTRPQGTLLYTGDFKLRASRTVEPARPEPADYLLTECTYGLRHFRFPPADQVAAQLVELCEHALRDNRQPIVMGYSLGKSQEIVRILSDAGLNVTLHGAPHAMCGIYEKFAVSLGRYRRYHYADFVGDSAIDLRERGVLVAPPHVARTAFVTRFDNPLRIIMTGWALLPNAIYRYGVDHALPLSDHADFDELIELIERVRPKKVYAHHGYRREFVETLRARGIDAEPAQPDAQLSLFE